MCILAGGAATRFPGKLSHKLGGVPLIERVYANVRGHYPVYFSVNATFSPDIDAVLDAPMIVDRFPGRGPLGGLITVFENVLHERIFAIAGDAPFVDAAALAALRDAWRPGDEAVTAEPLVALYDRAAFLRAAHHVVHSGSGALKDVVNRLNARSIDLPQRTRINVNTPADLQQARNYEALT